MTNTEIAKSFQLLGNIMELHGENPFKIRSYKSAYRNLRSLEQPLAEMSETEIAAIKGVGKAISGKIRELVETGSMQTLEKYKAKTPEGIQEMLNIKGFGPKKIMAVWEGLGVESVGELLYAVNENRLVELNGFGKKTQESLKEKLEYYQKSRNKFHYASLEQPGKNLVEYIQSVLPEAMVSLCGAIRRKAIVLDTIEILIATSGSTDKIFENGQLIKTGEKEDRILAITDESFPVTLYVCEAEAFGSQLFQYTASEGFLQAFTQHTTQSIPQVEREEGVFQKAGIPYIAPELREQEWGLQLAVDGDLPELLTDEDVKGVLHLHTTYSDGAHTLRDMAEYARSQGYEYLGLTDHSKSAFYANGLSAERVLAQMEEVEILNSELAPFKIFKGIESDILNDGQLDYEEDLLQKFDFIIASVHSNLRMDEAKATQRIITAIENPYTTILGHPTGRLLLSRPAYPIDHQKVIDACAANGVAIELNANPYRLDLDWSWIPYALEKGVFISINPDAHSKQGIHDIHFGVCAARKGGLTAEACLNAKSRSDFEQWLQSK
jgi:DNA polymerase (family 10)